MSSSSPYTTTRKYQIQHGAEEKSNKYGKGDMGEGQNRMELMSEIWIHFWPRLDTFSPIHKKGQSKK